jgi:hypothetical protein
VAQAKHKPTENPCPLSGGGFLLGKEIMAARKVVRKHKDTKKDSAKSNKEKKHSKSHKKDSSRR